MYLAAPVEEGSAVDVYGGGIEDDGLDVGDGDVAMVVIVVENVGEKTVVAVSVFDKVVAGMFTLVVVSIVDAMESFIAVAEEFRLSCAELVALSIVDAMKRLVVVTEEVRGSRPELVVD